MSQNIVILSGSPRKGGNTDKLVAAFKEGAESARKNVTVFRTADMSISGCLGCRHCFSEKITCVQQDDMDTIWNALKKSGYYSFCLTGLFFWRKRPTETGDRPYLFHAQCSKFNKKSRPAAKLRR